MIETTVSRGSIEQRQFERLVAAMPIRFYLMDDESAAKLEADAAYRETRLETLASTPQPRTVLSGVTENISLGGLCLVSETPLNPGTFVVADMYPPSLPKPLRALAQVMRSDRAAVVDRTAPSFRNGLKIIAINKNDMKEIQNYLLQLRFSRR